MAVCVVTYRRPEGLVRLLEGLEALRFPETEPEIRVVVVDNDPEESARAVCRHAVSWLPHPLTYATEKRRGIPQARNAALAIARDESDFVAFLDDDEVPSEDWLAELLEARDHHGADAVTGPCLPRFEVEPPAWVVEGRFLERPRHADGARLSVAFTHNVLVRTEALAAMEALFDEDMALTGGSDAELFRRFSRAGFSIVWADSAVVYEIQPPARATLSWLLARSWRVGTSTARIDLRHDPGARTALHLLLHGGWCLAKGAFLVGLGSFRGPATAAQGLRLAVFGAGRIAGLAGVRYREYAG